MGEKILGVVCVLWCNIPNLLDELILRQRGLVEFHLVALTDELFASGLVDVLKEENPDVPGVEGLELL